MQKNFKPITKVNNLYPYRQILVLFLIFIIFMYISLLVCAFNPYSDDTSSFTQDEDNPNVFISPNSISWDTEKLITEYDKIPAVIKALFEQKGINFYIVPYESKTEPANMTTTASAWPAILNVGTDGKVIKNITRKGWVTCYTDLGGRYFAPEQIVYAAGCELDNLVSYMHGFYTGTDNAMSDGIDWLSIYNTDNAKKLEKLWHFDELSEYNWPMSRADGFADAFRMYVCHPEELSEASPEVYSFMSNMVSGLNNFYHYMYGGIPGTTDTLPKKQQVKYTVSTQKDTTQGISVESAETADASSIGSSAEDITKELVEQTENQNNDILKQLIDTIVSNKKILYALDIAGAVILGLAIGFVCHVVLAAIKKKTKKEKQSKVKPMKKVVLEESSKEGIVTEKPVLEKEPQPTKKGSRKARKNKRQKENAPVPKDEQETVQEPAAILVNENNIQTTSKKLNKKQKNEMLKNAISETRAISYEELLNLKSYEKQAGFQESLSGIYIVQNRVARADIAGTSEDIYMAAKETIGHHPSNNHVHQERLVKYWNVKLIPLEKTGFQNINELDAALKRIYTTK